MLVWKQTPGLMLRVFDTTDNATMGVWSWNVYVFLVLCIFPFGCATVSGREPPLKCGVCSRSLYVPPSLS